MMPQTASSSSKQRELMKDRKKLVSQIDMRNLKLYDDKMNFSSPKSPTTYTMPMTQKNASAKRINVITGSPKGIYSHVRKHSEDSKHTYLKTESLKGFISKVDPKNQKEHITTEMGIKSDQIYKSFPYANGLMSKSGAKNLPLSPKKTFRTEISQVELKPEITEMGIPAKNTEKYHTIKHNEVIKQIEAQIQMHRRVKKPVHATKSVALPTNYKDITTSNETKNTEQTALVSAIGTHRRNNSTKDIPFNKLELPVRPSLVLNGYGNHLAPCEREEITKFEEIYYISDMGHKLPAKSEEEYDDERGDYIVIRNDHVNYRYEVLEMLGRGSFGQVQVYKSIYSNYQ